MFHPSQSSFETSGRVRDGRGAPVTCAACGCRLEPSSDGAAWLHFNPIGGRDARGCRIACADAAHDDLGRPISLAIA